jgi:hypothetical protein
MDTLSGSHQVIFLYLNQKTPFYTFSHLKRPVSNEKRCKKLKMSDKTLAKALSKNIPYNGFYFKELGSKLNHF